jgi:hypothetical protein
VKIESEKDFKQLQTQFADWRKRFPMFIHDVKQIEHMVNDRIQEYSKHLVGYRQTHSKSYLEKAQKEIDSINQILSTVEKIELMAILSQR